MGAQAAFAGAVKESPKLSVLVAFRDREELRVARFLEGLAAQSFQDFEVVFLDYGSAPELAAAVKRTVSALPFARYVRNETFGRPWNRAHALNSAARESRGQYLLCTDIDLVYSRTALGRLAGEASPDAALSGGFFLLPRNFRDWDKLADEGPLGLRRSSEATLGAIQLVPREVFFRIGGFDEFYRIWGVEDFDFQERLARAGCRHRRLELPPIFHQWHPSAASPAMPAGWLELMNFHALSGSADPRRGGDDWGRLLGPGDRPSLGADLGLPGVRRFNLPEPGWAGQAAWSKVSFLRKFLGELASAGSGSVFVCELADSPGSRLRALAARTVLRRRFRPLAGRRFCDWNREGRDLLWYVAQFSPQVGDYRLEDDGRRLRAVFVRR